MEHTVEAQKKCVEPYMATTPVIWEAEVSDQPGLHGVGGHLRFILRPCLNLPTPPKSLINVRS